LAGFKVLRGSRREWRDAGAGAADAGGLQITDWSRADDDHAPKTMNRAGWREAIKTGNGLE